jgi:hypothetical protein
MQKNIEARSVETERNNRICRIAFSGRMMKSFLTRITHYPAAEGDPAYPVFYETTTLTIG